MRRVSELQPADYTSKTDPLLLRHGTPDMILSVKGIKFYAHSKVLRLYSQKIGEMMDNADPIYGKQIQIMSVAGRQRTQAGVRALLNVVYPPQLMPPPDLCHEVYDIAREYNMFLLIEKMKVGIARQCDISLLEVAQHALEQLHPEERVTTFPHVIFDAFAEYTVDEFQAIPGYSRLCLRTKLEIARRRVAMLEEHLAKKNCAEHRRSHPELFRRCPPELAELADDEARLPRGGLAASGSFAGTLRSASFGSSGGCSGAWPPWSGGTTWSSTGEASPSRSGASARQARPRSAGGASRPRPRG